MKLDVLKNCFAKISLSVSRTQTQRWLLHPASSICRTESKIDSIFLHSKPFSNYKFTTKENLTFSFMPFKKILLTRYFYLTSRYAWSQDVKFVLNMEFQSLSPWVERCSVDVSRCISFYRFLFDSSTVHIQDSEFYRIIEGVCICHHDLILWRCSPNIQRSLCVSMSWRFSSSTFFRISLSL